MAVMVEDPNKVAQRSKSKRKRPHDARGKAVQLGHDLRKLHSSWWRATCRSGPTNGQRARAWLAETGVPGRRKQSPGPARGREARFQDSADRHAGRL
eukprot:7258399-Pyramimonas_sp.AAC.1